MRRRLIDVFILVYLALHAWALVQGIEDYPLTAAVMFARDIGPERPLYTMHWLVTDAEGRRSDVDPKRLGLPPRHFFLRVYLPALADSPYHHRHRPADSPTAHEERVGLWLRLFSRRWAAVSGAVLDHVDLVLRPYGRTAGEEMRLGTFSAADGRYRLASRDAGQR